MSVNLEPLHHLPIQEQESPDVDNVPGPQHTHSPDAYSMYIVHTCSDGQGYGRQAFCQTLLNFSLSILPRYVIAESNGGSRAYLC
jgi:hypothetical protein